MRKLMNISLSLAMALTLCTAVVPAVNFDDEEETTEEAGISPLSDLPIDTDIRP